MNYKCGVSLNKMMGEMVRWAERAPNVHYVDLGYGHFAHQELILKLPWKWCILKGVLIYSLENREETKQMNNYKAVTYSFFYIKK